jgi:hypothetical protein
MALADQPLKPILRYPVEWDAIESVISPIQWHSPVALRALWVFRPNSLSVDWILRLIMD